MEKARTVGRYELLEHLGHTGTSDLYRGRDTLLGREVAVKIMAGGFLGDAAAHARFFREARAAARLQHVNIVTIFEFGEQDDTPYIVMELLRGRSLAERLQQPPPPAIRDALDTVIQLCAGLEAAHGQGVVHRNVTPRNIWMCQDGTVKLLDFGIATTATSSAVVADAGDDLRYLSPEQITGKDVDARTDVFSAGVVLYEMLSGRHPFQADSPTGIMLKIVNDEAGSLEGARAPGALRVAVERALQKSPLLRYARAADFARDLKAVKSSMSVQTDIALPPVELTETTEPLVPVPETSGAKRPSVLGGVPVSDRLLLALVLALTLLVGTLAAYCG